VCSRSAAAGRIQKAWRGRAGVGGEGAGLGAGGWRPGQGGRHRRDVRAERREHGVCAAPCNGRCTRGRRGRCRSSRTCTRRRARARRASRPRLRRRRWRGCLRACVARGGRRWCRAEQTPAARVSAGWAGLGGTEAEGGAGWAARHAEGGPRGGATEELLASATGRADGSPREGTQPSHSWESTAASRRRKGGARGGTTPKMRRSRRGGSTPRSSGTSGARHALERIVDEVQAGVSCRSVARSTDPVPNVIAHWALSRKARMLSSGRASCACRAQANAPQAMPTNTTAIERVPRLYSTIEAAMRTAIEAHSQSTPRETPCRKARMVAARMHTCVAGYVQRTIRR